VASQFYASLDEVAAAYLFYLCRNHPFVDGNQTGGARFVPACFSGSTVWSRRRTARSGRSSTLDVAASRLDRDQDHQRLKALLAKATRRPTETVAIDQRRLAMTVGRCPPAMLFFMRLDASGDKIGGLNTVGCP